MERTLGGDRLGGGKKMKVHMRNYERSTHDLSHAWRSSMSAGTIVPCLKKVALPGDTFDIGIELSILTLPTIGPLFGTYQAQVDVFLTPMRLYNAELHMNMLGIGMRMDTVTLPQIELAAKAPNISMGDIDNLQINSSCIMKYLGVSGLGKKAAATEVVRQVNAVPLLIYWDEYKNYYANKMEGTGMMIHKSPPVDEVVFSGPANIFGGIPDPVEIPTDGTPDETEVEILANTYMQIFVDDLTTDMALENFEIQLNWNGLTLWVSINQLFANWTYNVTTNSLIGTTWTGLGKELGTGPIDIIKVRQIQYDGLKKIFDGAPKIIDFPLSAIDDARLKILQANAPVVIKASEGWVTPYTAMLEKRIYDADPATAVYSLQYNQEGLGLRTYKSDLFNNWLDKEWIDGVDGITAVTAVDTSGGSFTIDELNMSRKIYDMLNRIAISGGSYDDYIDAVYTEERQRAAESPMYMGGIIQDIIFQEVVATAQTEEGSLGQLAARGRTGHTFKGGKVVIKVEEPSYITANVSIVPNIDYSQGNDWDINLKTLADLHKPALDEIGFQDLITDQMAWFDTEAVNATTKTTQSAGKQPAWINYMTAVNKVYGNFADAGQQMWMTLARRYETGWPVNDEPNIADLTTYVDPSKFNHIFADTRIDAQNFWVQIGFGIEARRKMSAKVIPNL